MYPSITSHDTPMTRQWSPPLSSSNTSLYPGTRSGPSPAQTVNSTVIASDPVPLSLFQQTVKEQDDIFYSTFPAARPPNYQFASNFAGPGSIYSSAAARYDYTAHRTSSLSHAYNDSLSYTSLPSSGNFNSQSPQVAVRCPEPYVGRSFLPTLRERAFVSLSPPTALLRPSHLDMQAPALDGLPAPAPLRPIPPVHHKLHMDEDQLSKGGNHWPQVPSQSKPYRSLPPLDTDLDIAEAGEAAYPSPADSNGDESQNIDTASRTDSNLVPAHTTRAPRRFGSKKPVLACIFCRGRKIACGPPVPGGSDNACNQCQRRSLKCEFPCESRRGARKTPKNGKIRDAPAS